MPETKTDTYKRTYTSSHYLRKALAKAREGIAKAYENTKVTIGKSVKEIEKEVSATVEKVREKTAEVQVKVAGQATIMGSSIIREESPLVLAPIYQVLDDTQKTTIFISEMQRVLSNKEMSQLAKTLSFLKSNGISIPEILSLDIDDIRAFIATRNKGTLSNGLTSSDVLDCLPYELESRLSTWYKNAISVLVIQAGAESGEMDGIIRGYVQASAKPIPEKDALCLRLIKIATLILTGVALPRLNTIYQSVIWASMMGEMASVSTLPKSLAVSASFSLLVSYALHLGKQAVWDVAGLFKGNDSIIAPDILDKEASKQESLLWLSVLQVLVGHSLTLEDGLRMHETFVVGQSFKRILTLEGSSKAFFLNYLSSVSGDNLVSFLRLGIDPEQMERDRIQKHLELLCGTDNPTARLRAAYSAYIDCIKIAIAFGVKCSIPIHEDILNKVVSFFFKKCDGGPTEESFREGLSWMIIHGVSYLEEEKKGSCTLHNLNKALTIIYGIILMGKVQAAIAAATEKEMDWDSVGIYDSAKDNPGNFSEEGFPAFDGPSFKGGGTKKFTVKVTPTGGTIHPETIQVKLEGSKILVSCDGCAPVNLTTSSGNITLGVHHFKLSDLLTAIKSH